MKMNRMRIVKLSFALALCAAGFVGRGETLKDGGVWPDDRGVHINAHGGGVLFAEGRYWWFGEHKVAGKEGNLAMVGVHAYSSGDLANWKDEGIALAVEDNPKSDIFKGCILERPKVVRMPATGKYVMYFHLEKNADYTSALVGIAISDTPGGPYRYVKCLRPNAGQLPANARPEELTAEVFAASAKVGELPGGPNERAAAAEIWQGHVKGGQMCRDMTLFTDDDGKVYHIFASEHNSTLHVAELAADGLGYTGKWTRFAVKDWTEAPAVLKRNGWYFLVGSGCTGWAPNAARYYRARNILGPWERVGNPCVGVNPANGFGPEKTWGGQSTFILKVEGRDEFIAMFDVWCPTNAIDGRYIWRKVEFPADGQIRIPFGGGEPATVREIAQDYKTYSFSDPDPTPHPDTKIYPYGRYNGYAEEGATQAWKVVRLENKYIWVDIFPDIGGKVWNAHDKVNGKDFVYNNPVVKFRDIAMRGAWTSGGIEFNFGLIGHQPTVAAPVDYLTRTNADGSASCFLSSYDWMNGTFWSVEVRLASDRADFETAVSWFNASPLEQPYYQWMNAAYRAGGNAEYVFPGNAFIGHGTELDTWPFDGKGHDLRFYDNYAAFSGDASEHVLGHYNDFYGVYYHADGFGSVHYADYDAKLGMKIFLWSPGRDGAIWEDLLTDGGGQYVELQSGRLFNQPAWSKWTSYKCGGFSPMMTDRWTERWFPVAAIGGFDKASPLGALRVERENGNLDLSFSSLTDARRTVRVFDGERKVAEFDDFFKTLTPWTRTLDGLGSIADGRLTVTVDGDGLVYTERREAFELSRPKKSTYDYEGTVYGNYALGVQGIREKSWAWAEKNFKKALELDGDYLPAGVKLAALYVGEGRYEEAMPYLDRAVAFDAYDGEANYLRALASRALGRTADAKDGFSLATRDGALRTAAFVGLAEMFAAEGNWAKSEGYARRALDCNAENLLARQILAVALRKRGETAAAREQIARALEVAPLWHFARAECAWLDAGGLRAGGFATLVRCELPNEVYREIALWYLSIGLYGEADELLSLAGNDPLALYLRGYAAFRQGKADDAVGFVRRANAISPLNVFPYRPEMLPVLDWAAGAADSPVLGYYRALVLWRNQRKADALEMMEKTRDFDFAPFYLARAELKGELKKPRKDDLLRALSLDPSYRTYAALVDEAEERGDWKSAVAWGEKGLAAHPGNFQLILKFAGSLCSDGQYERCLAELAGVRVMPAEGSWLGRHLYRLANLLRAVELAKAKQPDAARRFLDASYLWPETLGSGKPQDFRLDLRVEEYAEALLADVRGDSQARRKWLEKIVARKFSGEFNTLNFVSVLAMRDLGKGDWADAVLRGWESDKSIKSATVKSLACCRALYRGDWARAAELVSPAPREDNAAAWETPVRDVNIHILMKILETPKSP